MADIKKLGATFSGGHSDAIEKLKSLLGMTGYSMLGEERGLREIFENLGERNGLKWDEMLKVLTSQDKALGKVIPAIKRYQGHLNYLKKLTDAQKLPAIPGIGALSDEQVYYATGWKLTKGGMKWTRPRNSPYTESVPSPSVPRYKADYVGMEEIDVHPASEFFPATMEDVARFRREEADQTARKSRFSRIRHGQQAARMRLDMSDYDLFIHENKAKYGGREYADEAYRKMLLKSMPTFFKDSKLSTKALIDIKKLYDGAKGIPIFGPLARMAMAHPTVAAGAGALGAIQYVFGKSDEANTTVTKWQNAMNLYGKPSQAFTNAAMLAGITDIGQISKLYGKLTARYGDAEGFLKNFGAYMGGLSPRERTIIAESQQFDDTIVSLMDILSGNGHLNIDESRRIQAYKAIAETQKTIGWRSGSGVAATAQTVWYSLPSMTSGAARDMENFDYIKKGVTERFYETIDEHIDKTREAAESLDEAEKSGIQTTNNQTVNNESRAIYIAKVEVPANNPEEFVMALDRKFGGASGGDNRAVLASMGSGFLV